MSTHPEAHKVFTSQEYADMLLMYGKCDQKSLAAQKEYESKFPSRRRPHKDVFTNLYARVSQTGSVFTRIKERGVSSVSDQEHALREEEVVRLVEGNPRISIRDLSHRTGIPRTEIYRILTDEALYPYHFMKVQHLLDGDFERREKFCEWLVTHPNEIQRILFTDEAQFTRHGYLNVHNDHLWARENPHATVSKNFQERFHWNV